MEKLVSERLGFFLVSNDLLNNCQTGFRKQRSTLDQILKLQDKISKYNANKGFTVAAFLDFERAYDLLWKPGLMSKVKKLGINGNMFSFINSFIEDRTFQVKVGNDLSENKIQENGTPQGSILSPLLFLIMINDIEIGGNGVDLSLFADDSATYKSGKNLNKLIKDVQNSLDHISSWADKWGIKISATKSIGVIFTNKRKYEVSKKLNINGRELKFEDKIKFLGIIFDKELTWRDHIEYIVSRCNKRLNLMRSLTGTQWGASKTCLLTVYRALVRSLLDYGSEALDSAKQHLKNKLDSIQLRALKICCGAMHGTALAALQNECGELPLGIRRYKAQLCYSVKMKTIANHPSSDLLNDHWTNHYGKKSSKNCSIYDKTKKYFDQTKNKIEPLLKSKEELWTIEAFETDQSLAGLIQKSDPAIRCKTFALEKITSYDESLHVYTDGSKGSLGQTAAAFCIPEIEITKGLRLTNDLSVYTTELIAIRESLKWIIENETSDVLKNNKKIAIFTDSLSSVETIKCQASKSRPNLLRELFQLKKLIDNPIAIVWIPSHVDIKGNETADELAKQALNHPHVDLDIGLELSELKADINKHVLATWQDMWSSSLTGSHNKLIEPVVSTKNKCSNKSRAKEVIMSRLRLGKCWLNAYLHRIKRHPTGLCNTCHVAETIEHYLLDCRESQINVKLKEKCNESKIECNLKNALNSRELAEIICENINRKL
jgi:ribonuclease HI